MIFKPSSIEQAIQMIPPSASIFVHGGAATPNALLRELEGQRTRFQGATLAHLHTIGPANYSSPEMKKHFRTVNLFVGANVRKNLDYDNVDYLPCFLSEIPNLFRRRKYPLDVALLHVSKPDRFGYVSLGVSVDIARAAAESAGLVIAQVNPHMPRLHGDGVLHVDQFDALVEVNQDLPEVKNPAPTAEEKAIAGHISNLIEDGSTLQMGIGTIPDSVTGLLLDRKDLGVHTEMWSDGTLALIQAGVITNSRKKIHRGKCVSGFLMGTRKLYDFVDDNPSVIQLEMDYVNNPTTIARNPKVVAINSAVEVDLTGQICADSIGHDIVSGVGGQMDFMRGAALSDGGKPIIAINSSTKSGLSKIVHSLKPGAGVVTTRAHVHYVVTEFGVANLYGKTLGQRAKALIGISHPNHREALERACWKSID